MADIMTVIHVWQKDGAGDLHSLKMNLLATIVSHIKDCSVAVRKRKADGEHSKMARPASTWIFYRPLKTSQEFA